MEQGELQPRIYLDACFDVFHHGHANLLRQAKELGYVVVAGVHSDETIRQNKGECVYEEKERYAIVRSIRWVDEVIEDAPFSTNIEVLDKFNCQVSGHGGWDMNSPLPYPSGKDDDISISAITGKDSNYEVKAMNRFRELKRTPGVSTTNFIERLLSRVNGTSCPGSGTSLITSKMIGEFATKRSAEPEQTVVYVAGAFDLFHMGHITFLKQAKEFGDYLIVGLQSDQDVKRSQHYDPIMTLPERGLCLLACKYVDDALFGVGMTVTEELLDSLKVKIVVKSGDEDDAGEEDPYKIPRMRGILRVVERENGFSAADVVAKVRNNLNAMYQRNVKKELLELGAKEM